MSAQLFPLAPGWALGADDLQWIVLQRRNSRTQSGWKPVAYIACEKWILLRVLHELGVQLTAESQAKLNDLPDRFRDWRDAQARSPAPEK